MPLIQFDCNRPSGSRFHFLVGDFVNKIDGRAWIHQYVYGVVIDFDFGCGRIVFESKHMKTVQLSSSELSELDVRSGTSFVVLMVFTFGLEKHILVKCPVFWHLSQVTFLLRWQSRLWWPVAPHLPHDNFLVCWGWSVLEPLSMLVGLRCFLLCDWKRFLLSSFTLPLGDALLAASICFDWWAAASRVLPISRALSRVKFFFLKLFRT